MYLLVPFLRILDVVIGRDKIKNLVESRVNVTCRTQGRLFDTNLVYTDMNTLQPILLCLLRVIQGRELVDITTAKFPPPPLRNVQNTGERRP